MEQLEMDMKNTDEYLLANGYGELAGMSPRLEARFGRLMMEWISRKDEDGFALDKLFNPRLPKSSDQHNGQKKLAKIRNITSLTQIVQAAQGNGMTSTEFCKVIGITKKAAHKRILRQVESGYLRQFGTISGKKGGATKVYVLTSKGKRFLKGLGK